MLEPELKALAAGAGLVAWKQLVERLLKDAPANATALLEDWGTEERLIGLYKRLVEIRTVKTLWNTDQRVNLNDFYYPASIDGWGTTITTVDSFPSVSNVLVQAVVGHGKTLLLRYLCCQEMLRGRYIPVFIELRRLGNTTLETAILESLKDYALSG